MSELLGVADSFGFTCLGEIGPAPPEAPLSYYVEYGPDPSEPELRLFIACSASLPELPKPPPPKPSKPRKPRKPSLARVAREASKAGIEVGRYEIKPDGTVIVVIGKPASVEADNPWLADLHKVKQQ